MDKVAQEDVQNKDQLLSAQEALQSSVATRDGDKSENDGVRGMLARIAESIKYFEFDEARSVLEKVSDELGNITDDPDYSLLEMEFLCHRARVNWIVGNWTKALMDLEQIEQMKDDVADKTFLIKAHLIRGEILGNRGNYRGAVDTLMEGLSLADRMENHKQIARTCWALGKFYSRMGESSTGRRLLERAKLISDEHQDLPGMKPVMAAINNQIGLGHFRKKELDKAQLYFQETIDQLGEETYTFERAEALRYLGITRSILGDHKAALEYHSEALWVYQKNGYRLGQAKVFNSIGQTCLSLSRLNEAIHFMEKAERICRDLEADAEAATIYGKLGNVNMIKEEYDKAERFFTRDLEMCKKFGNVRAMAFACANLGECSIYLGKAEQAASFLNQSLELFRKVSDPINEQRVLLLLVKAQINNGRLEEAESLIEKLTGIISPREKSTDLGSLYMLQGVIYRHRKNWADASTNLNKSIEIFKGKGKSVHLGEAYYEYGLLSLGINDREGALAKFKEAFRIARDLNLIRQRQRFFRIIERIDEREIVTMLIEELE